MPSTDNPWQEAHRVLLCAGDGTSVCTWQFEFGPAGDLRVLLDERSPEGDRTGELVIVAGMALLSRGVTLPEADEIDAVDGPGLMLKLVVELLGRTIPAGPSSVATVARVDHQERAEDLTLHTLSASSEFAAPWQVVGEVRRTDDATLSFDVQFTYEQDSEGETSLRLHGTWDKTQPPLALDDRMSLEGWQVFSLGPRTSSSGVDYGTSSLRVQAATLGELRAGIDAGRDSQSPS